jgi:hypothetical protein
MSVPANILSRGRVAIERAIDQLPAALGMRPGQGQPDPIEAVSQNRAFLFLIHLAHDLIGAATVGEALERTLDVAFQAFPVHRGFVALRHEAALANLAAIAVERIREREVRQRLSRYHPPAMVE